MRHTEKLMREERWLLKEKYAGEVSSAFENDRERLRAGEPVDYVIGFTEFLGCSIDLSRRPFIPRVETEYWVERVIAEMKKQKGPLRVLDIFSGSGCVGVAVLRHIPNARVTFVDGEAHCIEQIKITLERNNVPRERCEVISSNVFERIFYTFDWILANPPYIATTARERVQPSVSKHEPGAALWGGEDGLDAARVFLTQAHEHLAPGGTLVMEFDDIQKEPLASLLQTLPYRDVSFQRDQFGRPRWLVACRERSSLV